MGDKVFKRIGGDGQPIPTKEQETHANHHDSEFTMCGMAFDYDDRLVGGKRGSEPTFEPVNCKQCINLLEAAHTFKKRNGKWY